MCYYPAMTTVPEAISRLPVDVKRRLPIPLMNQAEDGTHSFVAINGKTVLRILEEELCGICGEKLGFASAFVSGPLSFQNRAYADPPFHPACAEFAMTVCPHIIIPHAKRATDDRLDREVGKVYNAAGSVFEKPQEWVIAIAPTRETVAHFTSEGLLIRCGNPTKRISYMYDESGKLVRQ